MQICLSISCGYVCEYAGERGKLTEIVMIVSHTFRFVRTDKSAQITIQRDPDFIQTRILACADLSISPHTLTSVCRLLTT
jgi:hypothetical protein